MFKAILAACLACATLCTQAASPAAPVQVPASGRIERLENFPSRYVDARHVDVWLPAGYDGKQRFKVLYMHDGQMLFDASHTWNKQEWMVDETAGRLMAAGQLANTIVVGVWNNDKLRYSEYFPEKALAYLDDAKRQLLVGRGMEGKARADAYLKFLVEELKPAIDAKYATKPDRDNTAIMGSSMGGLISIYAISEYPQVFGAAGCMSTHWVGSHEQNASVPVAFFSYLLNKLPDPKTHRIYMDHGDQTLDALYGVHQDFVDVLMREKGYGEGNWLSRSFPGTDHSEKSWAARMDVPLQFLLGK